VLKTLTSLPAASRPAVEAAGVRAPYTGLAAVQACSAPMAAAQGITVSGAVFTADAADVPGSPPREAPV
jgi:hypothetical protein